MMDKFDKLILLEISNEISNKNVEEEIVCISKKH